MMKKKWKAILQNNMMAKCLSLQRCQRCKSEADIKDNNDGRSGSWWSEEVAVRWSLE